MNLIYNTGNIIRSSANFDKYRFPAILPTEEWGGSESRCYTNYIRPISNLFGNDAEAAHMSNDTFLGITKADKYAQTGIIRGCSLIGSHLTFSSEIRHYIEATPGMFIYKGELYHLYPACTACASQIESLINISSAHFAYTENKGYEGFILTISGNKVEAKDENGLTYFNSAAKVIYYLNKAMKETCGDDYEFINDDHRLESFILMPIFRTIFNTGSALSYYWSGSQIVLGGYDSNTLTFGYVTDENLVPIYDKTKYFGLTGAIFEDGTVLNSNLVYDYLKFGTDSTKYRLGQTVPVFNGLTSVNGMGISSTAQALTLKNTTNNTELICKKSYTLGDACAKDLATSSNDISTDDLVVTSQVLRNHISVGNLTFNGEHKINNKVIIRPQTTSGQKLFEAGMTDNDVVILDNGKTTINNATQADLATNTGALVVMGGIASARNIVAQGTIVSGNNIGTTSLRATKENITPFTESALDVINNLDIVNFNYKDDPEKNHKIGIIADDSHEYVATKKHNMLDHVNSIGLLFKAIQELSAENKALKEELNAIKSNNK